MGTYLRRFGLGVFDEVDKGVWDTGSNGVGYETADGWQDNRKTSRLSIQEFTVDQYCSKIHYTNKMYKHVQNSNDVNIYGAIVVNDGTQNTLYAHCQQLARTTNGNLVITVPQSMEDGTIFNIDTVLYADFVLEPNQAYYLILFTDLAQGYELILQSSGATPTFVELNGGTMYIYHSGEWHQAKKYIYHDPTLDPPEDTSPEGPDHLHVAGTTSNENYTPATCGTDGSYWITTRCAQCGARMSREKVIIPASGLHHFISSNGVESMYCLVCGTSNPNFNPDTV